MPVDVSQINGLAADLAKAGGEALAKARIAVVKSTAQVKRDAQAAAPVGDTGMLRGGITGQSKGLTGVITANAEYAGYNEFGTSRMPPRPFMMPSLDKTEPSFIEAMEKLAQVF